jgi:hypothetical protein
MDLKLTTLVLFMHLLQLVSPLENSHSRVFTDLVARESHQSCSAGCRPTSHVNQSMDLKFATLVLFMHLWQLLPPSENSPSTVFADLVARESPLTHSACGLLTHTLCQPVHGSQIGHPSVIYAFAAIGFPIGEQSQHGIH